MSQKCRLPAVAPLRAASMDALRLFVRSLDP